MYTGEKYKNGFENSGIYKQCLIWPNNISLKKVSHQLCSWQIKISSNQSSTTLRSQKLGALNTLKVLRFNKYNQLQYEQSEFNRYR